MCELNLKSSVRKGFCKTSVSLSGNNFSHKYHAIFVVDLQLFVSFFLCLFRVDIRNRTECLIRSDIGDY